MQAEFKFYGRRMVRPEHLNSVNRLFGGTLLSWVDEEAYIFAKCQLRTPHLVTRHFSEVNFVSAAVQDDIIEFGLHVVEFGTTSITVACRVRNKDSKKILIDIKRLVFVAVDKLGQPVPHGLGLDAAS
tara:strand:- start:338 stop:721 length:384 start_codon:yes stop_codon:yes gene_type:complete